MINSYSMAIAPNEPLPTSLHVTNMRSNTKYTFAKEAFPPGSTPMDFDGERLLWIETTEDGIRALK
jgi:hypothetical protein